jgi:hypothetical protein
MIALRHADSGEIQIVGSVDGYGEDWLEIAAPPAVDGWRWNHETQAWQSPPPPRIWQPAAFMGTLFTPAEVVALDRLPADLPAAPALPYAVALAKLARVVNLDDPVTGQLLAMCVAAGVLTQARAARILAGLPPA